jgi:hypothetical protein
MSAATIVVSLRWFPQTRGNFNCGCLNYLSFRGHTSLDWAPGATLAPGDVALPARIHPGLCRLVALPDHPFTNYNGGPTQRGRTSYRGLISEFSGNIQPMNSTFDNDLSQA